MLEIFLVVLLFSQQNGTGSKKDNAGGVWTQSFNHKEDTSPVSGVMIHQTMQDMACTYAIAGKQHVC